MKIITIKTKIKHLISRARPSFLRIKNVIRIKSIRSNSTYKTTGPPYLSTVLLQKRGLLTSLQYPTHQDFPPSRNVYK